VNPQVDDRHADALVNGTHVGFNRPGMPTLAREAPVMNTYPCRLLAFAPLLTLAACTSVSTTGPDGAVTVRSRAEFEEYVESVFRYQNLVGNDMISRTSMMEEIPEALLAAEEGMVQSCHHLNEMVVASAEGRTPTMNMKTALMRTIGDCDAAAHHLAAMLQGENQSAAVEGMSAF
jgi:hypothetical protein